MDDWKRSLDEVAAGLLNLEGYIQRVSLRGSHGLRTRGDRHEVPLVE